MKIIKLLLIFVFLLVPFVVAAPPFNDVIVSSYGIQIEYPVFDVRPYGDLTLHFHVFNSTSFVLTNDTTDCGFHLYNISGSHIVKNEDIEFDPPNDFEITIGVGNFTIGESYRYIVYCNNSLESGFAEVGFQITNDATVYDTAFRIKQLVIIISIGIICAFLLLLAFILDESHFAIKIFTFLHVIWLITIIPSTIILNDTALILYKAFSKYLWFFGIYILIYFSYYTLKKMGLIIPKQGG